jgi:hypothetical protein
VTNKTNISDKSQTDIENQPKKYLIRKRISGRIEIDPEIREECHTKSTDPNRIGLWRKEKETHREKYSCQSKKPKVSIATHTRLNRWTCAIEKVAIHEEMQYISMKELK